MTKIRLGRDSVPERLGLTLDSIIERAENLNGRRVDHAVYAMDFAAWRTVPEMKNSTREEQATWARRRRSAS